MTTEPDASRSSDTLQRIADWLAHPDTRMGDLASLRRMDPADPSGAALVLYRLLGDVGMVGEQSRAWSLIVHCLALAHGKHRSGGPNVGEALVALHYGEARLELLLRADAETLTDVLPRLARRLHAKGQLMDWWPLAKLILNRDLGRSKAAREKIACDYVIASQRTN